MQLSNDTPFCPFVFEAFGPQDDLLHVVLCRGTFDIQPDGRLTVSSEQQPVLLADKYRTEPLVSSVEIDTDLVPRKQATDITLNAVAHSPTGEPRADWLARLKVGDLLHSLRVTGTRRWEHSRLTGWQLTRPEPTLTVPLHYEYAFGGRQVRGDDVEVFQQNPVGRGFGHPRFADRREPIPAPQVEFPHEHVAQYGKDYRPAGWGPIAKHWLPRRELCGTADEDWKANRWPLRPLDFDFRYYQSAPETMVYPGFLRGDEAVEIKGCSQGGDIAFRLPGISIVLFAMDRAGRLTVEAMKPDTLHIDLVTRNVFLTWRIAFANNCELNSVQVVSGPRYIRKHGGQSAPDPGSS